MRSPDRSVASARDACPSRPSTDAQTARSTPASTPLPGTCSILRAPGSRNLDASLFKDFRLRERRRVEFRTEAFNLTNTPTFTLPNARSAVLTVGNAAFGKLSGSQTVGRQVQFGLKLVW